MDYQEWMYKRGHDWLEREKAERAANWQQARGNLQAALTEQAVRELFARVSKLEAAATAKVAKEK